MRWADGELTIDDRSRIADRIEGVLHLCKPDLTNEQIKQQANSLFITCCNGSSSKQNFYNKLESTIHELLCRHKYLKKIKKIIEQNDSLNWKEEIDIGIKVTLINKYLEIVYHPYYSNHHFETVLNNAITVLNQCLACTHQHEFFEQFVNALLTNSEHIRNSGFRLTYALSDAQFQMVWQKIEIASQSITTNSGFTNTSSASISSTSSSANPSSSSTSISSSSTTFASQLPHQSGLFQSAQPATKILGKRSRNEGESLLIPSGLTEIKKILYSGNNTLNWLDVFLVFNGYDEAQAFVEAMGKKLANSSPSAEITVRLRGYMESLSIVRVAAVAWQDNLGEIDGAKFYLNELAKYCDLTTVQQRFYKFNEANSLNDNELPPSLLRYQTNDSNIIRPNQSQS